MQTKKCFDKSEFEITDININITIPTMKMLIIVSNFIKVQYGHY